MESEHQTVTEPHQHDISLLDSEQASISEDAPDPWKTKLINFYSVHNPDKISNVENLLFQYKGNEDLLMRQLEEKYLRKNLASDGRNISSVEYNAADRLLSLANEVKRSLLVPTRSSSASSKSSQQLDGPRKGAVNDESDSSARQSAGDSLSGQKAIDWKNEKQSMIDYIETLKRTTEDVIRERDSVAQVLSVTKKQENSLVKKLDEERTKMAKLENDLKRANAAYDQRGNQIKELLKENGHLSSQMEIILGQLSPDMIREEDLRIAAPEEETGRSMLERALESSRLSAYLAHGESERVRNESRKMQKTIDDLNDKLSSLAAREQVERRDRCEIQRRLEAQVEEARRRDAKISELEVRIGEVTEENERMASELKECRGKISDHSAARDAAVEFYRDQVRSAQQRAADEVAKVKAFLESERLKLMESAREIREAVNLAANEETKAARRELDVTVSELFRTRAERSKLEREKAQLKVELQRAAERLAAREM